jgi:hypothetical protein
VRPLSRPTTRSLRYVGSATTCAVQRLSAGGEPFDHHSQLQSLAGPSGNQCSCRAKCDHHSTPTPKVTNERRAVRTHPIGGVAANCDRLAGFAGAALQKAHRVWCRVGVGWGEVGESDASCLLCSCVLPPQELKSVFELIGSAMQHESGSCLERESSPASKV